MRTCGIKAISTDFMEKTLEKADPKKCLSAWRLRDRAQDLVEVAFPAVLSVEWNWPKAFCTVPLFVVIRRADTRFSIRAAAEKDLWELPEERLEAPRRT